MIFKFGMLNPISPNFNYKYNNYPQVNFCGVQKGLEKLDKAITKYSQKEKLSFCDRLKFQFILMKNSFKLMRDENFISEGHDAAVFKISDKYVSRNQKYSKGDKLKISLVNKSDNPFENIESYFGNPLFESGFMKILKNANTDDKFYPCGTPLHTDLTPPTLNEIRKYDKEYLPLCASLPQESYDILVRDFKKLGEKGYLPDVVNPGNVIISGDKFKIVDELTPIKYGANLFDVLRMLLIKYSQMFYAEPKPQLFEPRKEIFRKSLIAGEKANLNVGDGLFINEDEEWVLEDLLYNHQTGACKIFDKLWHIKEKGDSSLAQRIDIINEHFRDMHLK